jgi:CheY-like chemotaxis protein
MLPTAQLAINLPPSRLDDVTLRAPADLPLALSRHAPTVPPTVLVIDDHPDSRTIGRLLLESAGYHVIEACTGPDGLSAAREYLPSVVLLDIVLPGLDGWHVARQLRWGATTHHMVLIAMTALGGVPDVTRSFQVGFDEVLIKPVPPMQLLTTVQRYVGRVERQVADR